MAKILALRREDADKVGELRTAITPEAVEKLTKKGFTVLVQPRTSVENGTIKRIFTDENYLQAGATITENISLAPVIFGLKEIKTNFIEQNKTYVFFSHTFKGQKRNLGMLKNLMEKKCTVIDYELITDANGRRKVAPFTKFAGFSGMIDTLHAFGKRLEALGIENDFSAVSQTIEKANLELSRKEVVELGKKIQLNGTSANLPPVVCVFAGNGGVSKGAQEIFDLLSPTEIKISDLQNIFENGSRNKIYKLCLDVTELYKPKNAATEKITFEHYKANPELYESAVPDFINFVSIWVNGVNWSENYPRLLTYENFEQLFTTSFGTTLKAIGDISCDPEGSIQCSQATWIDNPVFIFNPKTKERKFGFAGEGIALMAITNLPCELPTESSIAFNEALAPYVVEIAETDFSQPFEKLTVSEDVKRAMILQKGKLTEKYGYLEKFLDLT
ncbi:hypothetical protein IT568_04015 [bacterium]|nr:hypothetical protein [bacterium]